MEKNNKALVAASLLAADFSRLGEDIKRIEQAGADWLHYDVMDGTFVPNISFGEVVLESISGIITKPLDVHLMIGDPARYIGDFTVKGVGSVTVHHESADDIRPALKAIRAAGCLAGVSVKPKTPISVIEPYIDLVDMILVMTVEPGFGGQSFMTDMLDKISAARALADSTGRNIHIEVDGGINDKTAALVKAHGADVLVSGSYLFKAKDPAAAVDSLKA
ncbi:MAG: ribulose-phosphate 3-epimerase [Ruminococcus sp.]|nr:ribulose-phosphate 3-epimerase [Ruminococcus sp.]